jgi:hypothetical protein
MTRSDRTPAVTMPALQVASPSSGTSQRPPPGTAGAALASPSDPSKQHQQQPAPRAAVSASASAPASASGRYPGKQAEIGDSRALGDFSGSASEPDLREELELMGEVQAALRDGLGARALELTALHAGRFPRGQLARERLAAEVFAACQAGQSERALRAASRFLERDSSSLLAERVRNACPFRRQQ